MKKPKWRNFLFFIPLFLVFGCHGPVTPPKTSPGFMDFSQIPWDAGAVPLDGLWLFYPEQLYTPQDFKDGLLPGAVPIRVPDVWNELKTPKGPMGALGYGTYRLTVQVPPTNQHLALKINTLGSAFRLWVEDDELASSGRVSTTVEQGLPGYNPGVFLIQKTQSTLHITVQVSNFHHKEGGIWYSWQLGPVQTVTQVRQNLLLIDIFLFGSLLIMGIYNIGLYFHLRRDFSPLFFGILCLALGLRIILYGEYLIYLMVPNIPWEFLQKLGYFTLYWGPPLFFLFIRSLYPNEMKRLPVQLTLIVSGVFTIWTLVTPYLYFSQTLTIFQFLLLASAGYMVAILVLAFFRKRPGSPFFLMGFFVLFLTVVNDVLHTSLVIRTFHMIPFGIFFFIVFQSFVLTKNFAQAFRRVDLLSENLREMNLSMARFVPTEFLRYLGKESIKDIKLGDHRLQDMAILFTDIRSFTSLSEWMTPEENFRFINSYLRRISPSIQTHGGFVDKFLGDGIMALFPEGPEAAVKGALGIFTALVEYNQHRKNSGYRPVKIGIGIHCGPLMMGTIGSPDRMDSTVISDTVNLASRLEGLTKVYHADCIVSLDTLSRLGSPDLFGHRFLGVATVKGKTLPIPIYEVFETDAAWIRERKLQSKESFERAVNLYIAGEKAKAKKEFQDILRANSHDRPAWAYLRMLSPRKHKKTAP